ncbi:protein FAM200C-like [Oratosquilla oratoria]|uniref:protein FAM200C-like n=1 Tax=Oratosquilla oratoria TaxID=337810 RepID=UPI003F75A17A
MSDIKWQQPACRGVGFVASYPSYPKRFVTGINALKNDKESQIMKADKSNCVVTVNKIDYIEKMDTLLSDQEMYVKLNKNPLETVNNPIRSVILNQGGVDHFQGGRELSGEKYKFFQLIQNIKYFAMSAKKRKYIEDYIRFGFVSLQRGDTEVPQCVICYKTLSNDGMRPSRLERHLRTSHPALVDKPKAFFETKKDTLKRAKLDDSGSFRQQSSKVVEASYEIAMLIAKSKKSHNIGESLIKPSILCAAELVLEKDSANKLSQISLSNDTVKKRIDELSQDIKVQTLDQVRASPVFAIQCDETTDVAQCSQLLMYARFVSDFFQENQLSWESVVGVCTDGAPAMRGLRSGFVTKVKERNPSVMSTHCILHLEALASRTLPVEMMDVLNVAIKIVNFVKAGALNSRLFKLLCKDMESEHEALLFHTNVRWLSKGNMLGRLYELRKEVEIFLDSQQKVDLYDKFQSEGFHATLAYLVDIFEGNVASFRNLDTALADSNLDSELKEQIITHLSDLKSEFVRYFPDIDDKREAWKFIRNPFQCEVADVAEEVQEEFLELKFDSTAKEDFKDMDLETFWVKYLHVYPLTSHQALRILTMFGSTYMCETAFSTLVSIKTKYRNRLNVEGDLRCALSSIRPRILDLVAKKQCQISH